MDQHNSHSSENQPPRAGSPPGASTAPRDLAPAAAPSRPVERPLTVGQVQRVFERRLGFTVSANTLNRWCRVGKIRAFRLGPEWRIPRETVEEIIKAALNGERF